MQMRGVWPRNNDNNNDNDADDRFNTIQFNWLPSFQKIPRCTQHFVHLMKYTFADMNLRRKTLNSQSLLCVRLHERDTDNNISSQRIKEYSLPKYRTVRQRKYTGTSHQPHHISLANVLNHNSKYTCITTIYLHRYCLCYSFLLLLLVVYRLLNRSVFTLFLTLYWNNFQCKRYVLVQVFLSRSQSH